jgi:RNA-directed DNA polymerase
MKNWHSQRYKNKGKSLKISDDIIQNAVSIAENVIQHNKEILPIFTLAHLAKQSATKLRTLDILVTRQRLKPDVPNYRVFSIRKNSPKNKEKRIICIPCKELYNIQSFINQNILVYLNSHKAVVSYKKGSKIYEAAEHHCESKWLIKIDLKDFFDSINEVHVYRVYRNIGYSPLLSLQMAKLCTRIIPNRKINISKMVNESKVYSLEKYVHPHIGSLPQGSPSSPILSNLVGKNMDKDIEYISREYNIIYTRYSDDLFLSTSDKDMSRAKCEELVYKVYNIVKSHGFEPNLAKTKIIPPGARKVVLGLIVNGEEPKLSKSYKSNLLQHLHFCTRVDVGPNKHAKHKNFDSVIGFRNHLKGLISYAIQIDSKFGNKALTQFNKVQWLL